MPTLRIATWNINSVRLRAPLVVRFLEQYQPDILCLQETKCPPGQFPAAAFKQAGYPHIADNGYTGHHGVAIVSRLAFSQHSVKSFCDQNDGRHVCINPQGTSLFVHSLYVPAGGDEPDAAINPKFAHKLRFLDELKDWGQAIRSTAGQQHILTGDLNIAPLEHDVWSHKQLLRVVSHTPEETSRMQDIMQACQFHDPVRAHRPEPEKLYSWWSYRSKEWDKADKGRRLDHIWVPEEMSRLCRATSIIREARGWERPSDHVPVMLDLDVPA
ncbi:MAG: exodeoxyribonuclease III [Anderseniella sp.]|nr:exodeoxyribonuclease III [Anderseniella sp.]